MFVNKKILRSKERNIRSTFLENSVRIKIKYHLSVNINKKLNESIQKLQSVLDYQNFGINACTTNRSTSVLANLIIDSIKRCCQVYHQVVFY